MFQKDIWDVQVYVKDIQVQMVLVGKFKSMWTKDWFMDDKFNKILNLLLHVKIYELPMVPSAWNHNKIGRFFLRLWKRIRRIV
jgi:hypothetical protein